MKISEQMKTSIGTKVVKSYPMTKKEYCDYRGWAVPEGENPDEPVYLIEYEADPKSKPNHIDHKGYISMSPKHVFDKAYKSNGELTFGMAIMAMKEGKKISRTGWNGADMFLYYVPAAKYKAQTSVIMDMGYEDGLIPYRAYMALKTAQGDIATWSPSGSDALAEDWVIID